MQKHIPKYTQLARCFDLVISITLSLLSLTVGMSVLFDLKVLPINAALSAFFLFVAFLFYYRSYKTVQRGVNLPYLLIQIMELLVIIALLLGALYRVVGEKLPVFG